MPTRARNLLWRLSMKTCMFDKEDMMAAITFRDTLNRTLPGREKVIEAVKDILYIK